MEEIILFDGVCNLCNYFVQFVIKRDKNNIFKFSSLQSEFGQNLLRKFEKVNSEPDTVVLYKEEKMFTESTAAIKILSQLGFGYKFFFVFLIIPKFIRDAFYRFVADNRYRWFGKRDSCMVPTEELKNKFIN